MFLAIFFFLGVFSNDAIALSPDKKCKGIVFEDLNHNLKKDPQEKGIKGVLVSNGKEVVQTDDKGRYSLPAYDEMIVFITKPGGYSIPQNQLQVPQFHYIHQPKGSPEAIKEFDGIKPTGELPDAVDFALFKTKESDIFEMIVFGDTQVTDHIEIGYLRDSIISKAIGTKAVFGISMGDNVNDVLSLYDRYLSVMGEIGIPIYYVPGNHDINYDSPGDKYQFETYKRVLGPAYYSFEYGRVHFVVLDSVYYEGSRKYRGKIGTKQLGWLKNDLAFVPQDKLIVLNMHIPLVSWIEKEESSQMVEDRNELYRLLKGRKVLALAGHTHTLERFLPGEEYEEWNGETPIPQIIVGAACGSWWKGAKDERGIPVSYQRDGAPNGYMLFKFKGNQFSEQYISVGREVENQMNISFLSRRRWLSVEGILTDLPEGIITAPELSSTYVVANIFSGSKDSLVQCKVDDRPLVKMQKNNHIADPYANRLLGPIDDRLKPTSSTHIWIAPLPKDLEPGIHRLVVRTSDVYGQTSESIKLFEVWSSGN